MARVGCLPFIKTNHGYIQAVLYFASAILGLFVAIPVGISLRHFQGTCFLYAQIVWDNSVIWPWSESSCDFIIYFNIGLTMAYALAMGIFTTCVLWPTTTGHYKLIGNLQKHNTRYILAGLNPVFMVINSIITMLVIGAAGALTGGFIRTCEWTTQSMSEMDYLRGGSYSCIDAQSKIRWHEMKIVRGTSRGVYGKEFFNCFIIATIASWLLAVVWSAQLVFNILAGCQVCSCEIAEEKRKPDKSFRIAQKRSRMATPIGTPGGRIQEPVPLGQPMPPVYQLPPARGPGPDGYDGPGPQSYRGPPPQQPFRGPPSQSSYGRPMGSQSSYAPPPPRMSQSSYGGPPMGSQSLAGPPPGPEKPSPRGQMIQLQPLQPKTPTQSNA